MPPLETFDLSDRVPIGDALYTVTIKQAPLLDSEGNVCMCGVDFEHKELQISSAVPPHLRMLCACHATLAACRMETDSLIHVPVLGAIDCSQ